MINARITMKLTLIKIHPIILLGLTWQWIPTGATFRGHTTRRTTRKICGYFLRNATCLCSITHYRGSNFSIAPQTNHQQWRQSNTNGNRTVHSCKHHWRDVLTLRKNPKNFPSPLLPHPHYLRVAGHPPSMLHPSPPETGCYHCSSHHTGQEKGSRTLPQNTGQRRLSRSWRILEMTWLEDHSRTHEILGET